jgi:DNA-binding LacI/PurR family transcriptional regulator
MQAAAAERDGLVAAQGIGSESDSELKITRDLVEGERVDGVMLWPADRPGRSPAAEYLREQEIPVVIVPEPELPLYAEFNTVSNHDSSGQAHIVAHLVHQGHRRILFASDADVGDGYRAHRYGQYRRTLEAAGLEAAAPLVVGEPTPAVVPALRSEVADRLAEVTAVCCTTDRVAAVILSHCLKAGIRVPGDLAVGGYDNSVVAQMMDITSVEQHFERIGEAAVQVLLDEIEGVRTGPVHLSVESELVVRGSTWGGPGE